MMEAHTRLILGPTLSCMTRALGWGIRLSTVRTADEILVMARGRVVESGTHAQLVRQKGIYASLVARQGGLAGEPIPRAQVCVALRSKLACPAWVVTNQSVDKALCIAVPHDSA